MRFTRTLGVHKSCRRRKLDFIFTACLLIACRERKLPPPLNHFTNAANGAKRKVTRFPLVKNGFMRLPTQLGSSLSLISSSKGSPFSIFVDVFNVKNQATLGADSVTRGEI